MWSIKYILVLTEIATNLDGDEGHDRLVLAGKAANLLVKRNRILTRARPQSHVGLAIGAHDNLRARWLAGNGSGNNKCWAQRRGALHVKLRDKSAEGGNGLGDFAELWEKEKKSE